ncbi:DUF5696 domain-containing protein [Paenibacillus flagellatus]|uniref:Uncharacterized protein n=1 Tax=Paenibacillus flagellatus TaxID=2211139 RepID=A0A2V5KEG2_9BACL|nr:DUF5696 domain-containing protein [Paenibacillus flagellatus]PYI57492.1 hypothetical protein DLM86_03400 [Paenibacillus flagellatus]
MRKARMTIRLVVWAAVMAGFVAFLLAMERYEPQKAAAGGLAGAQSSPAGKEALARLGDLAAYAKVAETSRLALYADPVTSNIAVKDAATGAVWMSASDAPGDKLGGSQLLKDGAKAAFNVTFADTGRPIHELIRTNSVANAPKTAMERIPGGVRFAYEYAAYGVGFAIDYTLDGDKLRVAVPDASVRETGRVVLVSLEPLPNFGAGTDEDDGYVLYPDGSGAITTFKPSHPTYTKPYSARVYGPDDGVTAGREGEENAYLPVFGVRKNGAAFVAYMTGGEYDANVNFYPSGYVVNLNRVSAEWTFRRSFSAAIRKDQSVLNVERERSGSDFALDYVFLQPGRTEYADMAAAYRSYLLDSGKLVRRIRPGAPLPLALDLFMGVKEERVLRDRLVKATDFAQAKRMLERLQSAGVRSMSVVARGWMADGYGIVPDRFGASKELGGVAGLRELSAFARDNGHDLFLSVNLLDARSGNPGFSEQRDSVKAPNRLPVTNDFGTRFLMNAAQAYARFEADGGELAGYGAGVEFARLGETVVNDYNDRARLTRGQSAERWMALIDKARSMSGKTAVRGGNGYAFRAADRLSGIPMRSSGYVYTDESVPFVQLVLHGYVPYSDDIPHNLHYDAKEHVLKWVEYGGMPYFELTAIGPEPLRYTRYNELFSSAFDEWEPEVVRLYKELQTKLGDVWAQPMTGHRRLAEGVYETVYESGVRTVVNYGKTAYRSGDIAVGPQSYEVFRGGGGGR